MIWVSLTTMLTGSLEFVGWSFRNRSSRSFKSIKSYLWERRAGGKIVAGGNKGG